MKGKCSMKGFRLNPDREYVNKIINGTFKKEGHCPCRVLSDDTTLCPCDKFIQEGDCCCKLFVPLEK